MTINVTTHTFSNGVQFIVYDNDPDHIGVRQPNSALTVLHERSVARDLFRQLKAQSYTYTTTTSSYEKSSTVADDSSDDWKGYAVLTAAALGAIAVPTMLGGGIGVVAMGSAFGISEAWLAVAGGAGAAKVADTVIKHTTSSPA